LETFIITSMIAASDGAGTRMHKHLLLTGSSTCDRVAFSHNVFFGCIAVKAAAPSKLPVLLLSRLLPW
jgi:hypothetical protein